MSTGMKSLGRLASLALALAAFAQVGFADGNHSAANPPPVSIQKGKFDDLRPPEEQSRFNNLLPLVEMVKHELFMTGFKVVDEADMSAAIEEWKKRQVLQGTESDLKLGVPAYFLRVKVLSYGFMTKRWTDAMNGSVQSAKYLSARMTATIVNAQTAELVGSANVAPLPLRVTLTQGASVDDSEGNYDEQMLQSINQGCAMQIVAELKRVMNPKFVPPPLSGKVLKVADYGVLVKIDPQKVKVGDVLDVFKLEDLGDEEEEDLGSEEIYVGSVAVSEIKPKYVVCSRMPESADAAFEKKMLVRPTTRKGSQNPPSDPF